MRSLAFLSLVGALAVSISGDIHTAHAHPDHAGKGHGHEHDSPHVITEKEKEKRLARVIRQAERRQRNRPQRAKDRRMHLRNSVARKLKGAELTPEIVAHLKDQARRTAMIRQIRYIAAQQEDFETVVRADVIFARGNHQHELWWRKTLEGLKGKK